MNSSVLSGPSSGTGQGSEVIFQCNEGLFPSNEITIVCTSEERWSPDPEGIVCGEEQGQYAYTYVLVHVLLLMDVVIYSELLSSKCPKKWFS